MFAAKTTMFGIGAVPPLASAAVWNAVGKTTVFRVSCVCPAATPVFWSGIRPSYAELNAA